MISHNLNESFVPIFLCPPPFSFHYAMITLGLAKLSILRILLFYLHCPDFLFCECKWKLLWFAASLDNMLRVYISAVLKGLSHCKLKRAQTHLLLENIITSAVSTDH